MPLIAIFAFFRKLGPSDLPYQQGPCGKLPAWVSQTQVFVVFAVEGWLPAVLATERDKKGTKFGDQGTHEYFF